MEKVFFVLQDLTQSVPPACRVDLFNVVSSSFTEPPQNKNQSGEGRNALTLITPVLHELFVEHS